MRDEYIEKNSIKAIREDFKTKGVFYTPPELAIYMKNLLPNNVKEVYDPTCGSGALLSVFKDNVIKYGQDINEEQVNIAKKRLHNFIGVVGDTLKEPAFKDKKFDYIVANPPFSIKWEPKEDERFNNSPELPPAGKADYAFILHILHYLSETGKAIILEFPGILYRGQKEGKIRKWLIDENYVEKVIHIQGNKFEDTKIATCIIILNKKKTTTDITFIDDEIKKERQVTLDEIIKNDYILSVQTYVQEEKVKEQINPVELEMQARKKLIEKLKKELNFSKMVAKFENLNFQELLDDIEELIKSYR